MINNLLPNTANILLVDDNIENLRMLFDLLADESYEIRPVSSGKDALIAIENQQPDLILLDVVIADIDGFEICKKLKADDHTKEIPIIFITAKDSIDDITKGLALGAFDYVTKPYNIAIVKARIRTQLMLKQQKDLLILQKVKLLEQNENLQAFSYSVSHDLKSPLNIISFYSDFIKKKFIEQQDDQALKEINHIIGACNRMYTLIDELLLLSKADSVQPKHEIIDLSDMANGIIAMLKTIDKTRDIKFICEPELFTYGAKEQIEIVMFNLLQNAWKYTAKKELAIIEIGSQESAEGLVIYIKDNGIGFDMQYAKSLFHNITRLHASKEYEGNGIGLTIVNRIIKNHNGDIWINSEVGVGTVVYFRLETN